ncbi:co-chaperone GroES [Marinilabilia rubra]|uniref:10 kDa chaperonin n=1 Tax=Marinilabilia rubra TaxID=2162893 RepID=A0A2U2B888_9BACT|nr:co-chaperone GroES [Marinilabilia rubra]PWD99275.1 co-chaperone GroES [Marinilabilia rubra]
MKELQPINQNVLLELQDDKAEQTTASGIIIPESAQSKEKTGKVSGISNIENPEIAVGDVVLYKEFSGTELEFESKSFLLVPYADILGKVVETDAI